MTENVDKNGSSSVAETEAKIIRQIEYYFGDYNLSRDKFLKEAMKADDGWVPMDTMLKFQRLAQITKDGDLVISSLKKAESGLMEVDEANKKIRRCPDKPLPEEEVDKARTKMTVYLKGFEKTKTTLDDLIDFFGKFENVVNVYMRTWLDKKSKSKNFKGSVFVTFKDRESAEKFLAQESVKNPEGEELIRKWQEDYLEDKRQELEAKKKKVTEHRAGAKKVKEAVEKTEEAADENKLPKGALLKLEQLNDTTTREMLREKLQTDFGIKHDDIAFIYYNKGEPMAVLRFKEKDAAKTLVEKIEESLKAAEGEEKKKFQINEAEVTVRVLDGQEETTFLDKCLADMTTNRGRSGHKRKGGFQGGRGGKRGRR